MLEPNFVAATMLRNANKFAEAYYRALQPLCLETGLPPLAVDILLFLANNPAFDTARDIVERKQFTKSHVSASGGGAGTARLSAGRVPGGEPKNGTPGPRRGRNRRYAQVRRPRGRFLQPCSWDSRKRNGCAWGRP